MAMRANETVVRTVASVAPIDEARRLADHLEQLLAAVASAPGPADSVARVRMAHALAVSLVDGLRGARRAHSA